MTNDRRQLSLYQEDCSADSKLDSQTVEQYLADFTLGGTRHTVIDEVIVGGLNIPRYTNEFWTAAQRRGLSLHEVSYRACFKPQLPRFFTDLFTHEGDTVYDPFMGRGTTLIEAASLGRRVAGNDINPLAAVMARPRLSPPDIQAVSERLQKIEYDYSLRADIDLSMFYHPRTEAEIVSLRRYMADRAASGTEDDVDRWIRMTATNRLTGHSSGFFSVYTLPPNQAVSQQSQLKINAKRGQQPPYRDTRAIILRKTASLLRGLEADTATRLRAAAETAIFACRDAGCVPELTDASVALTVTSPPFLDVVQYAA
ncbi:MAG: DNA methyltransferase, partial [bacterium]|nr:DNA methyltransferase [bacterium]